MKFEDFIARGQVKRGKPDITLVKAILEMGKLDLKFLKNIPINEFSARKVMSNYYDVLRSILEAIAAQEGYKVYSHEAFTYYLKAKGESVLSIKFDRFRKIRNGLNYYGKDISVAEVIGNTQEIRQMIVDLQSKYLK